eukprot:348364-Prymnesium_polylepis.1
MQRAFAADFAADTDAHYFAGSMAPRTARPVGMRFRVGDVYFHRQTGAFGIVLGWDDRRRAPFGGWGRLTPERLYAVHYSVYEMLDEVDNADDEVLYSRGSISDGHSRYIIEDNMLSIRQVWAGELPDGQLRP